MLSPLSSPTIVLKRVEQPLPGRPRTNRSSPGFVTPSTLLKILCSLLLSEFSAKRRRRGASRTEATVACTLLVVANPVTSRFLKANEARRDFSSSSSTSLTIHLAHFRALKLGLVGLTMGSSGAKMAAEFELDAISWAVESNP